MAKQGMLFDFHNMLFQNFWLEVANKISLSTQSLPLQVLKFPVKKGIFFTTTKCCILWDMLFAVSKNECAENYMKLVLNTSS